MNEIDDDDDDEDLEAELLALTKGSAPKPRPKRINIEIVLSLFTSNSVLISISISAKSVVNPNELNQMIQDSLRDIPSDEEVSSGEDDPSIMVFIRHTNVNTCVKFLLCLYVILFTGSAK